MPRPLRELRPHESARAFFGAELRHWRSLRNYSQDELGNLTLNSGDTISKVEKASRWPTEQLAQRCDMVLETGGALKRLLPLVLAERNGPDVEVVTGTARARHIALPSLDFGIVERAEAGRSVVAALLDAVNTVQPAPVVISGPGGFGKTVLALQVCRDERLVQSFTDVLWVETGQDCTPARVVQLVADLCERLRGKRPAVANLEQAGFHLAEAIGERCVLLVVDNVWAAADVAPFLLGGPRCVRLVTTRNAGVCRVRSHLLRLSPMSGAEIARLLDNASPTLLDPGQTRRLAALSGGWPLLASVLGASVTQDVAAGASDVVAVERAAAALRDDGPEAFDVWDASHREGTIGRAVASSLRCLDEHVTFTGGAELRERYLDLAIFPAATPIPLSVLGDWWRPEHGWTLTGVRQFARILAERSLVGSYLAEKDAVVLHDVFRNCLRRLARRPEVEVHKSLVDSFRAQAPAGWAHLDHAQDYAWRFLAHHLDEAGYPGEVVEVLADPDYIVTKLCVFGHESLANDMLALSSASSRVEPSDDIGIARALVGSTYLAANIDRRDDVSATLLASLALVGHLESDAARGLRRRMGEGFELRWATPETGDGHGHTGAVTAVATARGRVVTGGEDGSVRLWDRVSRRLLRVLRGHHGWVYAVAFSPSSDLIASAGDDAVIRLWSATTGRLAGVLTGHTKRIRSLAFDSSGRRLVSGAEDGALIVWSTDPGARVQDLATDGCPTWSVAVGHGDTLVAAGGEDENVRLYDLDTGRLLDTEPGHRDWVRAVAFAAGSPLLVSGSGDGSVSLWNVADGHLTLLRTTHTGARVRCLTVSADAGSVAAAGEDAVLRTLTAEGVGDAVPMPPGVDWIRAIATVNPGETVLGCEDGAVRLVRGDRVAEIAPGRDTVWSTAFTPDGLQAILGRSDGTIDLRSADSGTTVKRLDAGRGRVWALDSGAGYVAAACGDGAVRVWNLADPMWKITLGEGGPHTWAVAIDPGGHALAASSGSGALQMWDLPSGTLRWQTQAHQGRVRTIAFDMAGRTIVSGGGDGAVRVWDSTSGAQVLDIPCATGWVRAVGVNDDGSHVVVGLGSGDISVHTMAGERAPVHLFGHGGRVLAASFIAGGDELVTAAADGTVRLWSCGTQRQRSQVRVDAALQCACVDRRTGSVLASSSAGVVALELRRGERET